MGQLLSYAGDFRSSAEAISSGALTAARLSNSQDLSSAGFSLCVRTPFDAARNRRIQKIVILTHLVLVALLMLSGAAVAAYGLLMQLRFAPVFMVAGGIVLVAGGLLASVAIDIDNWMVRRRLAMLQAPTPRFAPTIAPVIVRVEDPQTCNQLKIVVDDTGILYCDTVRQLIVIEGIVDRYVIHGRDVRECYIQANRSARYCVLTFKVAGQGECLTIALNYTSRTIIQERKRSAGQTRPPLADILETTLGIVVAPDPTTA